MWCGNLKHSVAIHAPYFYSLLFNWKLLKSSTNAVSYSKCFNDNLLTKLNAVQPLENKWEHLSLHVHGFAEKYLTFGKLFSCLVVNNFILYFERSFNSSMMSSIRTDNKDRINTNRSAEKVSWCFMIHCEMHNNLSQKKKKLVKWKIYCYMQIWLS